MSAPSLKFLHAFVMYKLPQKPKYLLICALMKTNCDAKTKYSGNLLSPSQTLPQLRSLLAFP